jgi:hypothetical protein
VSQLKPCPVGDRNQINSRPQQTKGRGHYHEYFRGRHRDHPCNCFAYIPYFLTGTHAKRCSQRIPFGRLALPDFAQQIAAALANGAEAESAGASRRLKEINHVYRNAVDDVIPAGGRPFGPDSCPVAQHAGRTPDNLTTMYRVTKYVH